MSKSRTKWDFRISYILPILFCGPLNAQKSISAEAFLAWERQIEFLSFDIRKEPDSLYFPSLLTSNPSQWMDSLGNRQRLVIFGEMNQTQNIAKELVSAGYPSDSVYIISDIHHLPQKFPSNFKLPIELLDRNYPVPQNPTPHEIKVLTSGLHNFLFIDIRTSQELEGGMIPGAHNISWPGEFSKSAESFPSNQYLIMYCRSGNRVRQAEAFLLSLGFDSSKIINAGGFLDWKSSPFTIAIPSKNQKK